MNQDGGQEIYKNKQQQRLWWYHQNLEFLSNEVHMDKINKQLRNYKQIF